MSICIDNLRVPYICEAFRTQRIVDRFWESATQDPEDWARILNVRAAESDDELRSMAELVQGAAFFGLMQKLFEPSGLDVDDAHFIHYRALSADALDGASMPNTSSVDADAGCRNGEEVGGALDADERLLDDDREALIRTQRPLITYLIYWKALETSRDDFEARKKSVWPKHQALFNTTARLMNELIVLRAKAYSRDRLDKPPSILDTIVLSVIFLVEELQATAKRLFGTSEWVSKWKLDNETWYRLRTKGWCNGEITILHRKFWSASRIFHLWASDRRALRKDHSNCNDNSCRADYIDPGTHQTKHASQQCHCPHIGGKVDEVTAVELLEGDLVPVITVHEPEEPSATALLRFKSTRDTPYVAISHVWSDGLGNPRRNTLPQCQLRRIQSFVDALYDESRRPVPFWIDTICVPLEKQYRSKAIRLMGHTYRAADKVLVIDSWLFQEGLDSGTVLNLIRLKACTWSQRLWTGQEAMLARKGRLHFQTSNGSVSERELSDWYQHSWSVHKHMDAWIDTADNVLHDKLPWVRDRIVRAAARCEDVEELEELHPGYPRYNLRKYDALFYQHRPRAKRDRALVDGLYAWVLGPHILDEVHEYFYQIRRVANDENDTMRPEGLLQVAKGIGNRSTSRVEDEPVCFATLLGQDTSQMLDEPCAEQRMKMVVSQLDKVPFEILFINAPRIDEYGYRWAPRSYSQDWTLGRTNIITSVLAEVRREGLLMKTAGILIEPGRLPQLPQDFTLDFEERQYIVRPSADLLYPPCSSSSQLAILWMNAHYGETRRLDSQVNEAVLVEIVRKEAGIVFARFVCLLSSWAIDGTVRAATLSGSFLRDKKLQWCVG